MKRFITCPNCGQKLLKAEIGSNVEVTCPSCKQPFEITVGPESVITTSKGVNKSQIKTA